jgi:hypothetical protein
MTTATVKPADFTLRLACFGQNVSTLRDITRFQNQTWSYFHRQCTSTDIQTAMPMYKGTQSQATLATTFKSVSLTFLDPELSSRHPSGISKLRVAPRFWKFCAVLHKLSSDEVLNPDRYAYRNGKSKDS